MEMNNGLRTMASALAAIQAHQAQMPAIRIAGTQALNRLVPIALRDSGQSRVLGRFLLSVYNGEDFPFVMSDLRSLDLPLFEDCLKVLMMDYTPDLEVHERIANGSQIWQRLIEQWAPETLE
ncbi:MULTISPECIES: hypothetical protein [Pseudomonas]|uniref:DUF7673 family protein n=1 Tax=Pseudomonas TaxID=286 RepID=UPI001D93CD52|nr:MULTISPECIES: hypothetical protein [unclassified Pseudomonas]MBP2273728.1 hypothetical protein [Pseudomonas sp. BP6]MBP2287301.1 hypothetical protein [Pseudomonas sp. BP7]